MKMQHLTVSGRISSDDARSCNFAGVHVTISEYDGDGITTDVGVHLRLDDSSSDLTYSSHPTAAEALTELAERWEAVAKELRALADKENLAAWHALPRPNCKHCGVKCDGPNDNVCGVRADLGHCL